MVLRQGLRWCPCYEAANRLANWGIELIFANTHIDFSPSFVKQHLSEEIIPSDQLRWEEEIQSRNFFHVLSRVYERRTWTCPLLKSAVTEHGLFPSYYNSFRIKRLDRACPFWSTLDPSTSEKFLMECAWSQSIRDGFCPKLSAIPDRNYFIVVELRKSHQAFLRERETNLWWGNINGNPYLRLS